MISKIFSTHKSNCWKNYWQKRQGIIDWIKVKWGYKKLLKPFYFINFQESLELGAGKAYLSRILNKQVRYTICIDNDLMSVVNNQDFVDKYYFGDMFEYKLPKTELVLSCGVIEHFKIPKLKKLAKKINSPYILMFYPSCDWKWRLLWKLRGITLTHYQHSNEDLKKVFGKYRTTFGYINFFGLHYNYVYGVK